LPTAVEVATRDLERQGFGTFHPTLSERKLRRNRLHTIAAPVFPGYFFVELHAGMRCLPARPASAPQKPA
jgi:hypothetical protein